MNQVRTQVVGMRRVLLILIPHLVALALILVVRLGVAFRPAEPVDLREMEARVKDLLREREAALRDRVQRTAAEPGLLRALANPQSEGEDTASRIEAFRLLREHLQGSSLDDAGLVLLGGNGEPVAWAGRICALQQSHLSKCLAQDGVIARGPTYGLLVRGRCLRSDDPRGGAVVGFLTVEVDYPFRNRYLRRRRLIEEALAVPGVEVRLTRPGEPGGEIPFKVEARRTSDRGTEGDRGDTEQRRAGWTAFGLLLWLAVLGVQVLRWRAPAAVRATVMAVAIALARVAASAMGLSAAIRYVWLTDPDIYATPFVADLAGRLRGVSAWLDPIARGLEGLTQGPADLFFSLLALAAIVLLLVRGFAPPAMPPAGRHRLGVRDLCLLALPLAWLLAIRFVSVVASSAVADGVAPLFLLEGNLVGPVRCTMELSLLCTAVAAIAGVAFCARWAGWGATGIPPALRVALAGACLVAVIPRGLPWEGDALMAAALIIPALGPLLRLRTKASVLWPLSAAMLVFPPLEAAEATNQHVLLRQRGSDLADTSGDAIVAATLDRCARSIAADPIVTQALREKSSKAEPAPGLALSLWQESDLAKKGEDCYIAIRRADSPKPISEFSFSLPKEWIPPDPFSTPQSDEVLPPHDVPFRRQAVVDSEGKPLGEVLIAILPQFSVAVRWGRASLLRVDPHIEQRIERLVLAEYKDGFPVLSPPEASPLPPVLPADLMRTLAETGREWREGERVGDATWETLYVARDGGRGLAFGLSRRLPTPLERFEAFLHFFLVFALAMSLVGLASFAARAALGRMPVTRTLGRLQVQLFAAFVLLALVPIAVLAVVHQRLRADEGRKDIEVSMRQVLGVAVRECENREEEIPREAREPRPGGTTEIGSPERLLRRHAPDLAQNSARAAGLDVVLYVDGKMLGTSRPELFQTELLPDWMDEDAFEQVVLRGRDTYLVTRAIGDYSLRIGYQRLVGGPKNRPIGVLAIPELETSTGSPGAFDSTVLLVFGIYGLAVTVVWLGSAAVSRRIAAPVEAMTLATRRAAAGDLSGRVSAQGTGEVAALVESFNRMLEDLQKGREALAKAEREAAWRGMARQIAHEIKNPLTPLKLSAQHLARAYQDGAPEFGKLLADCVEMIVQQVDLLGRIASDFSYFARLPDRRPQETDLNELIRGVVQLFGGAIEGRIATRLSLAQGVPRLWLDPDEWRRVLTNLVKNAIEAMEAGGTLTVETERGETPVPSRATGRRGGRVEQTASKPWVEIRVQDTGGGVPAEVREKLFQPYVTTKAHGTGLGLAICKKSIDDVGATIQMDNAPGGGTTVRIRIPFGPGTPVALPERRT